MHAGEYILALVGIVLGLALTDLAFSAHRLIRRRAEVKFDVTPILAALIAAYLVFLNFWGDYSHYHLATKVTLWSTLPNVAILFVNFLIAAAALPDEWEGKIELWRYYLETRRQFWVLIAIASIIATIYNAIDSWPPPPSEYVSGALVVVIAAIASFSERRWIQLLLLSFFLLMIVLSTSGFVISG